MIPIYALPFPEITPYMIKQPIYFVNNSFTVYSNAAHKCTKKKKPGCQLSFRQKIRGCSVVPVVATTM